LLPLPVLDKGFGCLPPQSRVRTVCIVLLSPRFQCFLGFLQREKPVLIQALCPEFAVEGRDVGVVGGLTRTTEIQLHPVAVRPGIERLAEELGAILYREAFGLPS